MSCNGDECFCMKDACGAQDANKVEDKPLHQYIPNRDISPTCIECSRGGCNGRCQTDDGKTAIYHGNYDYCRNRD